MGLENDTATAGLNIAVQWNGLVAEQTKLGAFEIATLDDRIVVAGSLNLSIPACKGYEVHQNQTEHDCQGLLSSTFTSD